MKSAEGTAAVIADIWLDKVRQKRKTAAKAMEQTEKKNAHHENLNHPETLTQTAYNTCVSCAGQSASPLSNRDSAREH